MGEIGEMARWLLLAWAVALCGVMVAVTPAWAGPLRLDRVMAGDFDWPHAHCEVQYTVTGAYLRCLACSHLLLSCANLVDHGATAHVHSSGHGIRTWRALLHLSLSR